MTDSGSTEKRGKTATRRKRGRGADPTQTKADLIDAAVSSLIEEGYRGTTARSIAARAECNQAAIYYHFGGIEEVLVQAMKLSSERRLARYQESIVDGLTLLEVVEKIEDLYIEDRASGHLGMLAELVGGITASPDLRAGIEAATAPWLNFVEERIREASKTLSFGSLLPSEDLADLVFSVVIGVEMRSKIDNRSDRPTRLFNLGKLLAGIVQSNGTQPDR